MPNRTIEDRLREEYFNLLPVIRRVAEHLEAEIRYRLLAITRSFEPFERAIIQSRVKECESAIGSLRRRRHRGQEGVIFDPDQEYTLAELKDLAGVRVLAFPRNRLSEIVATLGEIELFREWKSDPVLMDGKMLAFKYWGYCPAASTSIAGEYQVTSLLTGRFWEVQHSALYKPAFRLKDAVQAPEMQDSYRNVIAALNAFEEEFERLLRENPSQGSGNGNGFGRLD
jgi:hypothetical protein